jgi:hypothetical protein
MNTNKDERTDTNMFNDHIWRRFYVKCVTCGVGKVCKVLYQFVTCNVLSVALHASRVCIIEIKQNATPRI